MFNQVVLLSVASFALAGQWDTYPQVPKSASINGFADPIYDDLPKCAQQCVKASTGNTPCPYWDTGCLCVMPQWSGMVAQCIAEECEGQDVHDATSLAYELCTEVGANIWMMPASITAALTSAAGDAHVAAPSATETAWDYLNEDEDEDEDEDEETTTTTSSSSETGSSDSDSSEDATSSALGMKTKAGIFTVALGSLLAFVI